LLRIPVSPEVSAFLKDAALTVTRNQAVICGCWTWVNTDTLAHASTEMMKAVDFTTSAPPSTTEIVSRRSESGQEFRAQIAAIVVL
jgi:hypothetical protein